METVLGFFRPWVLAAACWCRSEPHLGVNSVLNTLLTTCRTTPNFLGCCEAGHTSVSTTELSVFSDTSAVSTNAP